MLRKFVEGGLLASAGITILSSIIYTVQGDERWFSRFAFALILLGLWYVGNKDE